MGFGLLFGLIVILGVEAFFWWLLFPRGSKPPEPKVFAAMRAEDKRR